MVTGKKKSRSYIYWLAWRNLVRRSKNSGLSFMTVVSIFGVALGVMALIIVLSVMGGFEEDLKSKMLRGQPHFEVLSQTAAAGFGLKQYPLKTFADFFPEAIDLEPFTQADVVLKQRRHLTSAVLFGVDPEREGHLWGFSDAITEGEMNAIGSTHPAAQSWDVEVRRPGILLGEDLAVQLGAELGDEISVVSPQASLDAALGGGTVSRQFVVAGKFRTGLFNYDAKWAVVALAEGRKFMPDYDESLDQDDFVTGVALNLADPFNVRDVEKRFIAAGGGERPLTESGVTSESAQKSDGTALSLEENSLFKGLIPLTWEKVNKSLLFALKLEKFAMGSILMLIVLVAAFSISGTMMMTVYHKRGQVSLLRSLGMSRQDIARLYLSHGFTIGTVGIAVGLGLGVAVCAVIKSFQVIPLPEGVYHLKALPCKWLPLDYAVICISAWLFSLVAAAYPAITAARQDPGQGLRYL